MHKSVHDTCIQNQTKQVKSKTLFKIVRSRDMKKKPDKIILFLTLIVTISYTLRQVHSLNKNLTHIQHTKIN